MKYGTLERETRAVRAWIDAGWVCVRLDDDREVRFPASKSRRLAAAPPDLLGKIEIICDG